MTEPDDWGDPEAPYGRNPKTGQPYKRSAEERAALSARLQAGKANARGGARTGTTPPPRTSQKSTPAGSPGYAQMVLGILQIPAMILQGMSKKKPILGADAVTIRMHAPAMAMAIENIAIADDRWASAIEKIAAVGPYGELVMATMMMTTQLAANHRLVPVVEAMGIIDPVDLLREAGFDVTVQEPAPPVSDDEPADAPAPQHDPAFSAF